MSDTILIPSGQDKNSASYATEPAHYVEFAELPPGMTLRPEGITLKHNIGAVSVVTMVLVSFLTFWMPLFGALMAGLFGGYHAGRMKRALAAAAVSSVAVPGMLWFLSFISEQPSLRFLLGLTFKQWVIAHVVGLFLGAISGVYSRQTFTDRELYEGVH